MHFRAYVLLKTNNVTIENYSMCDQEKQTGERSMSVWRMGCENIVGVVGVLAQQQENHVGVYVCAHTHVCNTGWRGGIIAL